MVHMAEKSTKNAQSGVRWLEISQDQAGQRVDNFLLTQLKGVPRSKIYTILRKGEVRVNKGRIKPQYRLQAGDQLRIPPVRISERTPAKPDSRALARVEQSIIYEDPRLLILNKPSGLAVHGGSGVSFGVIEALRALRPEALFLELVHRLDRDTSGCLMVAKKRSALRSLHELLRSNQVEKRYLALIKGKWQGSERRIEAPLRKNVISSGERIVRVDREGKAASSIFRPLAVSEFASLVEVSLETGRTHQIRVHAAHAGHPLAGDEKYGDEEFNRQLRRMGLRRLFLHAHALAFEFPDDHTHIEVSAPLDETLLDVLEKLDLAV